jgi:5-methylcytosine-specific restriction protein A
MTRLAVIARDMGICQMCGIVVREMAQIDHIVEKAAGGSDLESNLRLLCHSCHSKRHARGV